MVWLYVFITLDLIGRVTQSMPPFQMNMQINFTVSLEFWEYDFYVCYEKFFVLCMLDYRINIFWFPLNCIVMAKINANYFLYFYFSVDV